MTLFLHQYGSRLLLRAFALAFLAVIPQGPASSFAFAFAVASAVALAFLSVIPQGPASSSAFAFAVASEIGPGFSPDIQPLPRTRALAPGTLPWEPPQ